MARPLTVITCFTCGGWGWWKIQPEGSADWVIVKCWNCDGFGKLVECADGCYAPYVPLKGPWNPVKGIEHYV